MFQSFVAQADDAACNRSISADEITALSALIAYVARKGGSSEFRVGRDLADRFNIPNATCLPAALYEEALCYLADQIRDETVAALGHWVAAPCEA